MTRNEFLGRLADLYRFCNLQDTDQRADWTHPEMAGTAGCARFDQVLHELTSLGVLTTEQHQSFLDNL